MNNGLLAAAIIATALNLLNESDYGNFFKHIYERYSSVTSLQHVNELSAIIFAIIQDITEVED